MPPTSASREVVQQRRREAVRVCAKRPLEYHPADLPVSGGRVLPLRSGERHSVCRGGPDPRRQAGEDRKSTRLNSSHDQISYAVFCLKKKKKTKNSTAQLGPTTHKI